MTTIHSAVDTAIGYGVAGERGRATLAKRTQCADELRLDNWETDDGRVGAAPVGGFPTRERRVRRAVGGPRQS